MNAPVRPETPLRRLLLSTLLAIAPLTAAHAAVPFTAGPYRGELWSDPQTVAVGPASLHVTLRDAAGKPVPNARVGIFARMPSMPMGEREETGTADAARPGGYRSPARFAMDGAYTVTVRVSGPSGAASADLPLATGQTTGGPPTDRSSGRPAGMPISFGSIGWSWIFWIAAALFTLYTLARARRAGIRVDPRRRANRQTIVGLVLLAVMVLAARYAVARFRRPGSMNPIAAQAMAMETPPPPGVAPVELASVDRGPVEERVEYTGSVVGFVEQDVAARTSGWILWMPFYAGDRVHQGQLLAKLDTRELDSRVAERKASREMAEQAALETRLEHRQALATAAQARSEVAGKAGALEEARQMKAKALAMVDGSRSELARAQLEVRASSSELRAARNDRSEAAAMSDSAETAAPQAEADLAAMQADQAYWVKEIARMKTLEEKGAVSGEEFQREQASARGADAKVRAAQARVQAARNDIRAAQARRDRADAMVDVAQAKAAQAEAQLTGARSGVDQARAEAAAASGRIRMAGGDLAAARSNARAMESQALAGEKKIGGAEASVREGNAAVTTAQVVAGYTEIRSLVDGVVTQRVVSPGVLVSPGQVILRVAQIRPIRLQANVAEGDLARIRVGSPVVAAAQEGTRRSITLRVSSITPSVDPVARTGVVEALYPNADGRFVPGESVSMAITTASARDVVRVSSAALRWRTPPLGGLVSTQPKAYAWVATPIPEKAGVFTVRSVDLRIGARGFERAEVLTGLAAGQRVVTSGYEALHDGDAAALAGSDAAEHPSASTGSNHPGGLSPGGSMPGMPGM